jgi:hypothetical protein
VTGLEVTSFRFSVSQPHFKNVSQILDHEEYICYPPPDKNTCTEEDIDTAIEMTFGEIPERWQMLARYFLASLLFHCEYLDKTMHKSSQVRESPIFRQEIFDCVRDCVMTCFLVVLNRRAIAPSCDVGPRPSSQGGTTRSTSPRRLNSS